MPGRSTPVTSNRWTIRTVTLAIVLIAACGQPGGAYFAAQDATAVGGPAPAGDQALLGITDLVARPGDTVQLVDARPTGESGQGTLTAFALPRSRTGGGGIGGVIGDTFDDGLSFSRYATPLQGFHFTTSDGTIEVVVEVRSAQNGRVSFDGVDLVFTVNGSGQQVEHFPSAGRVCFASPAPTGCP